MHMFDTLTLLIYRESSLADVRTYDSVLYIRSMSSIDVLSLSYSTAAYIFPSGHFLNNHAL